MLSRPVPFHEAWPLEPGEVYTMGIYEELAKQGYEFDNEYGCSEDRAEVWVNKKAKMAVRIEWMKIDEVGT